MWEYFKRACKNNFEKGEFSARNYQYIYNYIISNKDPSVNYLTHFNFKDADIVKIKIIADKLKKMKKKVQGGGGKKPKFIQSGGGITQEKADEFFWHGLIEYDKPGMNSVSFLLPKFLEISDFLIAPFADDKEEEARISSLCKSFDCAVDEEDEEDEEEEEIDMNELQHLFNSLGRTIQTDLEGIFDDNKKFYTNLLEDIYNDMNYKFGGLDMNENIKITELSELTNDDIKEEAKRLVRNANFIREAPTLSREPHLFKSFRTERKPQPNDESSDSEEMPGLEYVDDDGNTIEIIND